MSVIFLTEPPIGVAPNADLPSMRSVMAASISAAVVRLGVTSVVLPELTSGAAQLSVDNTAMPRNTALIAIFLLQYLQYQIVSLVPRNQ